MNHLGIQQEKEMDLAMGSGMALVSDQVMAVSNTIHKTNHHRQGTGFHESCTLEHHRHLTNNGCNRQPSSPRSSHGILCNFRCNKTRTLECQSCRNLDHRLVSLAPPILGSTVVVAPKVRLLRQAASNLLAVALDSSTPGSPNHHLPCKRSHASYMVGRPRTLSNIPHKCHPCALHSSLCNLHKCLVCLYLDHSKVHKLDLRIGQLAAVEWEDRFQ